MIPVRLVLHDFLSYADPAPLDFTFDVACLSGPNGVGKSSILDAMTWALFGAARGCEGGQNQDRLIRDTAEECSVEFTFTISDETYRITRRRSRAGKGEVRFEIADGDGWRNVAAETMKQTEQKIGELLRMDYRTFTASAFFLQGRSEDFLARLRPDERKEVLARLLDLGTYDRLEAAARDRARAADARRKELAASVEQLGSDQLDAGDIARQIAEAEARQADLTAHGEAAAKVLEAAQKDLGAIEAQVEVLQRATADLEATTLQHAEWMQRVSEKTQELEGVDALLARTDEVHAAIAELELLRTEEGSARAAQAKAAELEQERAAALAEIASDRRSLSEAVSAAGSQVSALETERARLHDCDAELAKVEAALAGAGDPKHALDDVRAQLREHELRSTRLEEQMRAVDERITVDNESLSLLASGKGECPVCAAPLDAKHRAEAKRRITEDIRSAKTDKQSLKASRDTERKEAKRCTEEIARLQTAITEHDDLAKQRLALVARLERRPLLEGELTRLTAAVEEASTALREESFARDARALAERLAGEIASTYDAQRHETILRRVRELEPYATLAGQIDHATERRITVITDLETATAKVTELAADIATKRRDVSRLVAKTTGLADAQRAVAEGRSALVTLRAAYVEIAQLLATLSERSALASRLERDLEEARRAEAAAALEHRRYRRLVEAFGRGGIPDLIIDNAIPELEEEANQILGRLTDHEMSVHFVLQRDTKSGKAKDTFEALVHHDGGVRDFAMFSGGEAFRVAFAVRLAMSKLLVRRAGARLETLVIDEGFGTQDPEGRERLVEAINVARSEFAKILVITHLDDLKDQFGTQIQVSKSLGGSTIAIVGG